MAADSTLEFRFLKELQTLRKGAHTLTGSGRLLEIQANLVYVNGSTRGLSLFSGCVTIEYNGDVRTRAVCR